MRSTSSIDGGCVAVVSLLNVEDRVDVDKLWPISWTIGQSIVVLYRSLLPTEVLGLDHALSAVLLLNIGKY